MKITVVPDQDYHFARIEGTIDESAKVLFDEQLHPLIERTGHRLLIDLSAADRITSTGIGLLVTLVSRANTKGGRVVLAGATPFVSSIFRLSRLNRFFDLAPTVEEGEVMLRNA